MTLLLILLLTLVVVPLLLLYVSRWGNRRRYTIVLDDEIVDIDIYTGHWVSKIILGASGVTLGSRIYLDYPGTRSDRGRVATIDLLVHEIGHVRQAQKLGLLYLPTYLLKSVVMIFGRKHPMELEASSFAVRWQDGLLTAAELELPDTLIRDYPHRTQREPRIATVLRMSPPDAVDDSDMGNIDDSRNSNAQT